MDMKAKATGKTNYDQLRRTREPVLGQRGTSRVPPTKFKTAHPTKTKPTNNMKTKTDSTISFKAMKLGPIQWFEDHPFAVEIKEAFGIANRCHPTKAKNKKPRSRHGSRAHLPWNREVAVQPQSPGQFLQNTTMESNT